MKKSHFTYKYRVTNFNKIPCEAIGLYAFWFRNRCLYIGQCKQQSLRKRLLQHFNESHNKKLSNWIKAYEYELDFCFLNLPKSKIDYFEKKFIKNWQPETNIHYK